MKLTNLVFSIFHQLWKYEVLTKKISGGIAYENSHLLILLLDVVEVKNIERKLYSRHMQLINLFTICSSGIALNLCQQAELSNSLSK